MAIARYEYRDMSAFRRVIAMSDLHGNRAGFLAALRKADFSDEDALVIVGDILEKGDESLPLLRTVKELYARGNTFMVLGNNDVAFWLWREGLATDADMLRYLEHTPQSVLKEMAAELALPYATLDDVARLKEAVFRVYGDLLAFLDSLPHILETERTIFVHAGLKPGPLTGQDHFYCVSAQAFAEETARFLKLVVVGHWPVTNYCDTILDANPRFNEKTNVLSIDGGNGLKSWGQINYVIFEPGREGFAAGYYDALPQVRLLDSRPETPDPVTLSFPNTRAEVIGERGDGVLCRLPYVGRELVIARDRLYDYRGTLYCADFTTYEPPNEAGEVVGYIEETDGGILVKRGGVIGLYRGRYEPVGDR